MQSLFCSPSLHLFDLKYSKNSNILKYLYYLKGTYYAPFYKMLNKSLMSPECVFEVLAQNTPQIICIAC